MLTANNRVNSDSQKRRRFALPLLAAGYAERYDNAHGYHHRHYKGNVSMVEDFSNYENLLDRFQQELKEFIK